MNRKDLLSLMEAYDDVILNKEFSPEDENEIDFSDKPNPEAGLEVKSVDDVGLDEPDMGLDEPDMGLDEPSDIDFSDGGLENQKIVIAHLTEFPDYYKRLLKLETAADKYWSTKKKPDIFL